VAKPCMLAPEAAARLLKSRVRALRNPIEATRTQDPDGIHDARVASRRLRAALGEHEAVFARSAFRPFYKDVRNITRLLGVARELDVTLGLLESARRTLHGAPRWALGYVVRRLRAMRADETAHVIEGVDLATSPNFDRALMALFEGLRPQSACYVKNAVVNLQGDYQSLYRIYGLWETVSSEDILHRIRIGFKKLRYTCELYAPLYGEPMELFLRDLKQAQEELGTWNDYRVLRNYVAAQRADATPRAKEGMPALLALIEGDVRRHLDAFAASSQAFFSHQRAREILNLLGKPQMACCRTKMPDPEALDLLY